MQLQDMVGRVRKTLGEPEPSGYGSQQPGQGSWDNDQLIGYINEALGILAHDWRHEATSTITLTQGQTQLPLPADCLEDGLRRLVYVTNGTSYPITYLDLDRFQQSSALQLTPPQTGFPIDRIIYTVWGGQVSIYPGAYNTGDQATFYYYQLPASLVNAADVPAIPPRFHIALVEYAIAEAQNAVEETNLEYDAAQKWEMYRQQFKAEMAKSQRDKGIRVRGRR